MTAADVAEVLRGYRYSYSSEEELHDQLEQVLRRHGVDPVFREYTLNLTSRIDFYCVGGVGVEVKVAGGNNALRRQLARYAAFDAIAGLVVVTTRTSHQVPIVLNGKPVETVSLALNRML